MANQPKVGGVFTYTLFKKESEYKTEATPDAFFGLETNFTANVTNELNPRRGSGGTSTSGRKIAAFAPGTRSTSITQDFDVTDFKFMELVLGKVDSVTTPTGKEYTTTDDTVSATIAHCIDDVTDDQDNVFTGCVVQSCSIRAALNDVLTASLSIDAAHPRYDDTLTAKVERSTAAPYKFVGSSVELPTGAVMDGIFDSVEFTVNNNYELYYGSAIESQAATKKELGVEVRVALKHITDNALNKALGGDGSSVESPTENVDVVFKLVRGTKNVTITATLAPIGTYALTSALNQPVSEDVTLTCQDIKIREDD